MKNFFLYFSLLAIFTTVSATPGLGNDSELTDGQRLAIMKIINDFLMFQDESPSPDDIQGDVFISASGNVINSGDSTTNSIKVTITVPSSNEILIETADGLVFNLTKINQSGQELAADAQGWSCLRDNTTGLIWETKTSSSGLHHQDDSFSWYDSNSAINIAKTAFADNSGATCSGYVPGAPSTYCNTEAYVSRVNSDGWCGYQDWRMPTIDELKGIISLNQASPDIYADLLPKGTENAVWSSSSVANFSGFSWHIYLNDGYAHGNDQSGNLPVLLVHNAQP